MFRSCLNVLTLSVVAVAAGGCEIQAQSLGVDGAFDRTLHTNGPIDLDVFSRSGEVRVRTGSSDTVHISGQIRAFGSLTFFDRYSATEQARKLESTPPIEQNGGRISVGYIDDDALASNVKISYDVTVPPNTRLRTSTRSGDQTIDAIDGPVTATSRSGRIHIGSVRGALDVETRSGDVELLNQHSNVHVTSRSGAVMLEGQPARWDVATRSGDVEVQLPQNGGVELDLDSRSGAIDSSRPMERSSTRVRNQVHGVVGSGGGHLAVTTRSGLVRIR